MMKHMCNKKHRCEAQPTGRFKKIKGDANHLLIKVGLFILKTFKNGIQMETKYI